MHFWKKALRGYNQTEEIAAGISKATGIKTQNILKAKKPHRTQTSMSQEKRRNNLKGVFELISDHNISCKHILLLDDVCTTGTTLSEAAQAIISASPTTRISILSLCATF